MAGKKALHMVHGEWMTVYEAAERLGVKWRTLEAWRTDHRRADGSRALLVEAWDHYRELQAGQIVVRRGRFAARHWVRGRRMTIPEAAERLGVNEHTLRAYLQKRRCSLDAAWRYYANKRQEQAVRQIVKIINGE